MTTKVNRGGPDAKFPGELTSIVISCDQLGCDHKIDDSQVRKGGGLHKMGWSHEPRDGKLLHYCPDHTH